MVFGANDMVYREGPIDSDESYDVYNSSFAVNPSGQITAAQREQFAERGAVGSHLENIQRKEGFKGFNQQKISDIIRRTDPRTAINAA